VLVRRAPFADTQRVRIAIDASSVPPQPAGAGVYAIELTRAMACRDARDGYAVFTRGEWFDDALASRRNWRIERVAPASRAGRLAWEQARLPARAGALKIDVLHSTHHTLPLRPMRARRVVTVHDVTFFRIPERYPPARRIYMRTLTRLSARVADAIVVPSQTVRRDVERTLGASSLKISTVYEAAAASYRPVATDVASTTARRYGLDGRYILSVGSLEPGKNRSRLIRALHALGDDTRDVALGIVGQPAWDYEPELALVESLGMKQRVRFLGYVPGGDVAALYSGGLCTALPSLYEGFGLPVLEAMASGSPVLTSNVSATAEVAGDAALLVDPQSLDAIRDGLRRLIADEDLRRDLSERGLWRAAEFSWRRAADETYAVYRRVYEQRDGR
jgi:glycosyltransferase involved in cell wall biosynthesis